MTSSSQMLALRVYLRMLAICLFLGDLRSAFALSTTPLRSKSSPSNQSLNHSRTRSTSRRSDNNVPKIQTKQQQQSQRKISTSSVGEQIQHATSLDDLLRAAEDLWLPTDANLAPHLRLQQVHHEKRLRWSAALLQKLGTMIIHANNNNNRHEALSSLLHDTRLQRAVMAAAVPFENRPETDRVEKELKWLKDAILGTYNILSVVALQQSSSDNKIILGNDNDSASFSSSPLQQGLQQMLVRAEHLAPLAALPDAVELYWACRGIQARLHHDDKILFEPQPNLQARVGRLPFDILPGALDWNQVMKSHHSNGDQDQNNNRNHCNDIPVTRQLQNEIDFHFDTIVTRTGARVTERRGTAWIAEPGIGALAYSGKLMPPQPISPMVRTLMRHVEAAILLDDDDDKHHQNYPRPFFDCALCNHYPDGDSACKFHTDPEHGTHWERLNCVVAAGVPRKFAFRPIPGLSTWSEWNDSTQSSDATDPNVPAVFTVFSGDVIKMDTSCNDDFHHAVYPDQGGKTAAQGSGNQCDQYQERVSLVLKRAIARNGGQRGHGIAGQGRRSRKKAAVGNPMKGIATQSKKNRRKRRRQ